MKYSKITREEAIRLAWLGQVVEDDLRAAQEDIVYLCGELDFLRGQLTEWAAQATLERDLRLEKERTLREPRSPS